MTRVVLENVMLFLLPTLLYVGYVYLTREPGRGATRVMDEAPLIWLFIAGSGAGDRDARRLRVDLGGQAGTALRAGGHEGRQDRSRPHRVESGMIGQETGGTPPSLAGAEWLARPATRAVFAAITVGGEQARAVGGAVRNALVGRPVTDIDIATTALPQEVLRLAAAAGLAAVPTVWRTARSP